MNFYQHSPAQINQLADALEDPDLDMNGLGWKAAFHLRELQRRIFELEAQLYAIGAGGVGESIQPQAQPDTAQIPDVRIRTSAPDGWKLVPAEPTDEMFIQGMDADLSGRPCLDDDKHVRSIWRAMLSVAPDAPQPPAAQQEPVAWRVHPFDYGVGYKGVYALTEMPERVEMWKRKGWKVEPLYTTPQPAENLHCKSTQKRLATLWGYVKQEPARQPLPADTYTALAHRIATRFTYSTDRSFCEYYFAIHTLEQFVRAIEQAHGITGSEQ